MALAKRMHEQWNNDFEDAEKMEVLITGSLVQLDRLTPEDRKCMEQFKNIRFLSMNGQGLSSLTSFPSFPALIMVLSMGSYHPLS